MFLLVETLESWYSGLVTALLEKPMKRVSPLKAGRSSRIKHSTSPVVRRDPTGLLPQRGSYPRFDEIVDEILRRANNEKCRRALDLLPTFCSDPQPARTDFPKDNVLDAILSMSDVNVRFDPGSNINISKTQHYPGFPGYPQETVITLGGDLGSVGTPISDQVLEIAFHELLHLSGVGHFDPNEAGTQGFLEGEAFLIHVARVCLGTSGKWASTNYVGTSLYWDKKYEQGGKLDNAIKACPLP